MPASRELKSENFVRCCHSTHRVVFRFSRGVAGGGQQQFATQTLGGDVRKVLKMQSIRKVQNRFSTFSLEDFLRAGDPQKKARKSSREDRENLPSIVLLDCVFREALLLLDGLNKIRRLQPPLRRLKVRLF